MSSHDPRPLLNEILNFLKENQIDDNLKDIKKSIENLTELGRSRPSSIGG